MKSGRMRSPNEAQTDDGIYYVDRILTEKQEYGRTYYLVLWDGDVEDDSTWGATAEYKRRNAT